MEREIVVNSFSSFKGGFRRERNVATRILIDLCSLWERKGEERRE